MVFLHKVDDVKFMKSICKIHGVFISISYKAIDFSILMVLWKSLAIRKNLRLKFTIRLNIQSSDIRLHKNQYEL